MLLTIIGQGREAGLTFIEFFNIVHGNELLNKILKFVLISSSHFPLVLQFHYLSLLNDI